MRILAIDIGTGTQDILLFDSSIEVENCLQMIMPSPTVRVAQQIRAATRRGKDIVLTGTIMGGGPSAWAAEDHLRAGHKVYATPGAALSFNDDLEQVRRTGIEIVAEEEAVHVRATPVRLQDYDLDALRGAFESFGQPFEFDAVAVAVFDHGNAPVEVSDRLFRFQFLAERLRNKGTLSAFAFMRDAVPVRLTRMQAVADSITTEQPVMVMDTAPAAILGALEDDRVRAHRTGIIANLGNFHTLAFRLDEGEITGCFEHHTGELKPGQLEELIRALAAGTLTHEDVFNTQGHGAWLREPKPIPLEFLAVVGPRRSLLLHSPLRPYFAVPYGDMMLAGAYGLVRAYADLNPEAAPAIDKAFASARELA